MKDDTRKIPWRQVTLRRTSTISNLLALSDEDLRSFLVAGARFEGDDLDDALELAREHRDSKDDRA